MLNKEYYKQFFYKTITPKIITELNSYGHYDRALYIECGDGFIIEFIFANEIHGMDDSTIQSIPAIKRIDAPDRVYDLIVLSEKEYTTYNTEQIYEWILKSSARIIAIIGTKEYMNKYEFGRKLNTIQLTDEFELKIYEFNESLRIYE
jgi:hypothetical protein